MLSYNSRTSGRKGLSRARIVIVMETFIHRVFFRGGVLSGGIHDWCRGGEWLTCWGSPCQWRGRLRVNLWSQNWGLWYTGRGGQAGAWMGGCWEEEEGQRRGLVGQRWAGPAGQCVAYPGTLQGSQLRTVPLLATGQSMFSTFLLNYLCHFCFMRAGFCGYEWNLCCTLD